MTDYDAVAAVLRDTMASIRADVALGAGPDIEADAPVLMIGDGLAQVFAADPAFDRERFYVAADLNDPIPEEAFRRF